MTLTYEELQPVYNFTVEDWHSYFVGSYCIWVHNGKNPCGTQSIVKDNASEIKPRLLTEAEKKTYKRPSGYRKGVREEVWEKAKGSDGIVRDPITQAPMDPNKPWDMGHKPGYEFSKHKQSAADRKISRNQFIDEHNNPNHYRPELPTSNRSHAGEDVTNKYFGS